MTVLEGPDYQNARDRIKGNPIIKMMAASVAAVPLAQIVHEDGTPRFAFMQQANRAFDDAEARNTGNPRYEPYPAGADRHLGLIAEAVLAERAAVRKTVASYRPYPAGTSPESDSLSSQCVEALDTIFADGDTDAGGRGAGWRSASGPCGLATRRCQRPSTTWTTPAPSPQGSPSPGDRWIRDTLAWNITRSGPEKGREGLAAEEAGRPLPALTTEPAGFPPACVAEVSQQVNPVRLPLDEGLGKISARYGQPLARVGVHRCYR